MFTHLYVSHEDAEKLFKALAPPRKEQGRQTVGASLDEHFKRFTQIYLEQLDATMEKGKPSPLSVYQKPVDLSESFVVKFRRFLPTLPDQFAELDIGKYVAELVRTNCAPTKARAGYYEDGLNGFCALVEHVAAQKPDKKPLPLYVHNITLSGLSLEHVHKWNRDLSQGELERLLVHAFE